MRRIGTPAAGRAFAAARRGRARRAARASSRGGAAAQPGEREVLAARVDVGRAGDRGDQAVIRQPAAAPGRARRSSDRAGRHERSSTSLPMA